MANIERRTVLQAAWVAPVVALAIGAPTASASVAGITLTWLPNGSSYQLLFTNNSGGVLPASTVFVVLTTFRGVTNVIFDASGWSQVDGDALTVTSLIDFADGATSIVYTSVTVNAPGVDATAEAQSDDYFTSARLILN